MVLAVAGGLALAAVSSRQVMQDMGVEPPLTILRIQELLGLRGLAVAASLAALGLGATISPGPPLRRGLAALGLAGAWLGLELAVPYEFLAAAREPAAPGELGRCGTGIWMSTWSFRGSLLLCPCAAVATMVFAAAWTKYASRLLREPVRPLAVEAGALGAVTSVPLAAVFLAGPEAPAARGATAVDARTATTCTLALLVVFAAAAARAWLVRPSGAASVASPSSR